MSWMDQFGPSAGTPMTTAQPDPRVPPGMPTGPTMPPTTPGLNPKQQLEEQSGDIKNINEQRAQTIQKATSARELLSNVGDLENAIRQAPEHTIHQFWGSDQPIIPGTPSGRALNRFYALSLPGEPGRQAKAILDAQDDISSQYLQLAGPLAKTMFGSVRGIGQGGGNEAGFQGLFSPPGNAIQQALHQLGGIDASSPEAALSQLASNKIKWWDWLDQANQQRLIDPGWIPTANTTADSFKLGRGAVFWGPDGKTHRNPRDEKTFNDTFHKFMPDEQK